MTTTVEVAPPRETGYATIIHVMALLGNFLYIAFVPFLNIIVPWVMWLCKKNENSFIDEHGREAIRFQLFMTLYWFLYAITLFVVYGVAIVTIGVSADPYVTNSEINSLANMLFGSFLLPLFFGLFLFIVGIFCPIKAAIRASDGKPYCYPFTFSPRKKNSV